MLRRDRLIRMQIHELMDACLFAVSFWLAYVLRSNADVIDLLNLPVIDSSDRYNYVWLYLLLIPAAPMILETQGFYNRPLLCPRATTAWMLFKGCVFTTLGLVLTLFLFRIEIARFVIIWFGCISFILVFAKEEFLSVLLQSKVAQAQYRRRFVLVAAANQTARLEAELRAARSHTDIDIMAQMDLNQMPVKRLVEMLHEHSVNGVLLDVNNFSRDRVEEALHACELEGVEVWVVADFFKPQISRVSLDDFLGRPILVFRSTPETSWQSVAKQVFDFIGAAIALVIAIPFLFLIAMAIKLMSPGPIFFKQKRSGLNGRPFTLYKFRTMVTNAEQFQQELAAMNEMSGPVFKVTNDPRITPIGRWLRRSSLDELPQLYNVLRGEMSLVGPRPLPVDEVKRFNDLAHRRRLSVRPGLTCLWQISGRNNVKDFKDWVRLDLEYIDNWSLWLDFKILCLTVPVVLVGTGAK